MSSASVDTIAHFLITLHTLIGHGATARFLGMENGDMSVCILCRYDRGEVDKLAVAQQIGQAP